MLGKRFFYICAGILCLALAYHLGATSATAQMGSSVVGIAANGNPFPGGDISVFVMTPNGDVFARQMNSAGSAPLTAVGNFWSGAPTPASRATWGEVKARYRLGAAAASQDK